MYIYTAIGSASSFVLPELHKAELTALAHGHTVGKTKRSFGF